MSRLDYVGADKISWRTAAPHVCLLGPGVSELFHKQPSLEIQSEESRIQQGFGEFIWLSKVQRS